MKIATWNVERLKHRRQRDAMLQLLAQVQADILVLTETDEALRPDYPSIFSTPPPSITHPELYRATENRVTICSLYPGICQYATYDPYTALCVELETEWGALVVYGTIIGVQGSRRPSYQPELLQQTADFGRLAAGGKPLLICGDFNCSFVDNYYYTKAGRALLLQSFADNRIQLLTGKIPESIDHIAVSSRFVAGASIETEEWNLDRKLSDHKGVAVQLIRDEKNQESKLDE